MFLGSIWTCVVIGLTYGMFKYSSKPVDEDSPTTVWPASSPLALDLNCPTLILFAHPRCPCTRASIGELDKLMAHCAGQLKANVVFVQPKGASNDWVETELKRSASKIPGVEVSVDSAGLLARLYQCQTSGTTLLWSSDGSLLFHGGITMARGHSGDNPGRFAIQAIVAGENPEMISTPVFGCALFDSRTLAGGAQ